MLTVLQVRRSAFRLADLAPRDPRPTGAPGERPRSNFGLPRLVAKAVGVLGVVGAIAVGVVVLEASAAHAATTVQSSSCVDGGGVRWSASVTWGDFYTVDGAQKVAIDAAAWTTTGGKVKTDSAVATYDGSGALVQTLTWSGLYDYRAGKVTKSRNPVNPDVSAGKAKVKITLGVDGDGKKDCSMVFVQPITAVPVTDPEPSADPTEPAPSSPAPSSPAPSSPAPSSPAPSSPAPSSPATGAASPSDVYESDVLSATNEERTTRGLVALSGADACVDKYAEQQAKAMAAESRMYHQDLQPILKECGLMAVGENVAYGYGSGDDVTQAWMNSEGHRANILNARYKLLGVGAVQDSQGRWYACQVFGSRS